MNKELFDVMTRVIAENGQDILPDTKRMKAVFADYSASVPLLEQRALGGCIENGAYFLLAHASTAEDRRKEMAVLAERLHAETGIDRVIYLDALEAFEAVVFGEAQEAGAGRAVGSRPRQQAVSAMLAQTASSGRSGKVVALAVVAVTVAVLSTYGISRIEGRRDVTPANCHHGFQITGQAKADVVALSERCAKPYGMTRFVSFHCEQGGADAITVELRSDHCYRFLCVGDKDTLLATDLRDGLGEREILRGTQLEGAVGVLPLDGMYCPDRSGEYLFDTANTGPYDCELWKAKR